MEHLQYFLTRVLTDRDTCSSVVYLFGETIDNEWSVLSAVRPYSGEKVAIPDISDGMYGFAGADRWTRLISQRGVVPMRIPAQTPSNTFTEAQQLVRMAKDEKWTDVTVVAPAFHMPRCFLSTISAALHEYPDLRVWARLGAHLPWDEEVVHSQGVTTGTRRDLFRGELERIEKYTKPGNLVSLADAIAYLEKRDAGR